MNYSKLAQSVEKSVFYFSDGFNRFGNRVDFVGFGHIALFLAQAFGIQRLDIFLGFSCRLVLTKFLKLRPGEGRSLGGLF